jgi:hypothetical protein
MLCASPRFASQIVFRLPQRPASDEAEGVEVWVDELNRISHQKGGSEVELTDTNNTYSIQTPSPESDAPVLLWLGKHRIPSVVVPKGQSSPLKERVQQLTPEMSQLLEQLTLPSPSRKLDVTL